LDSSTVTVLVVVIFALIVIFSFVVYQQRGEAEIKIFGISLKIKGSNETPPAKPAISAKDITSREGGLIANDGTGNGIEVEKVNVKDDVLLSSNKPSQASSNPQSFPNTLSASAMTAGGDITIQQFIGNQIPLPQQLEFFVRQIGLENIRTSNFANSQFQVYCDIWKSLQALRVAGDDLWKKVSDENLITYAEQLRKTTRFVQEGEIFFDDQDREQLLDILTEFQQYRLGKMRLAEIRTKIEVQKNIYAIIGVQQVERQIERNRENKLRYENMLDQVRVSFKARVSKL
jgi:hypothetical protein